MDVYILLNDDVFPIEDGKLLPAEFWGKFPTFDGRPVGFWGPFLFWTEVRIKG